ncbi:MAG TPA: M50 family metallopeptidase, partial [Actinomycetota bacterium]|nr:M50 family metallopeptidase [Actinomycetota bacterium]
RAFGIKVTEFFVGFGPRIWSTRRGETEVGFKWIPAGGYVKIAGMNPYEEVSPEDLPRTYGAKPRWQRALVIVAGPFTHFVLALVCFSLWLGLVGQPTIVNPRFTDVEEQLDGRASPAAAAGLREGDRVVAVDGIENPSQQFLVEYTQTHVDEPITLTIRRADRTFTVEVVPVLSEVAGVEVGRIGVALGGDVVRETEDPIGAVTGAATLTADYAAETVRNVGRVFGPEGVGRLFDLVFTDAPREAGDPASIVGVGRIAGSIASNPEGNFWDILFLFAIVNIFVGLLNLLPLPPFDGGHLAVLVIEKIRGRPVDMRRVIPVSAAVAAFFILFTVMVVYVDIVKPPAF